MGKTLLDLFRGSPQDTNVKQETETFVEQELTGVRVKSAVELNNPLIYGSDTIRIASRTTRTLETMKEGTNPDAGIVGGKINEWITDLSKGRANSLTDVGNIIGDKLGFPTAWIPTRVADEIDGTKKSVQDVLDERNGTAVGSLLKQNARGNPKTVLKQTLGASIKLGKDTLRTALFGDPTSTGVNEPGINRYYDYDTYTEQRKNDFYDGLQNADDVQAYYSSNMGIDMAKVSPVYGVDSSNTSMWESKQATSIKNAQENFGGSYGEKTKKSLSPYSPTTTYTGETGSPLDSTLIGESLEVKRGISNAEDSINQVDVTDAYSDKVKKDLEELDLVPLWIGYVNDNSFKLHFRTLINGVTETVSPSWGGNKFTGNPFSYHTYDGVERSVSFGLQLYCSNAEELKKMWNRVTRLSEYTYPSFYIGDSGKLVNPPIIEFRLGDIYVDKIGFIESLSYTLPDNGTWETDPMVGLLPKFIDVSLTIKFIENSNVVPNGLYGKKRILTASVSGDTIT